jgi:hypothetical protein
MSRDQKDEIREALQSLLSDIESMYVSAQPFAGSGQPEEFFGPFSVWKMDQSGCEPLASISWPNLAISARRAREALGESDEGCSSK